MEISVKNISTFFNTTTAHGFTRVAESRSLPVKFMWFCFLMSAIGGFSYHLSQLLINYISIPISANIAPDSVPFETPDIAVCSVSPISYTTFWETTTKTPSLYYEMLAMANQIITHTLTKGYAYDPSLLFQISRDTFAAKILLYALGHRKENFITRCRYKGAVCDFDDFTVFSNSKYANCFAFRPSQKLLNDTAHIAAFSLDLVLFTDTNPVLINANTATVYGVKSSAATFEGDIDVTKSGGVILYYGTKNEYPRSFVNLSPGLHSYIKFQMIAFKFVNRDNKPCNSDNSTVFYEDANENRVEFIKNRVDCQSRKLSNMIVENCKCFSTGLAFGYENSSETITVPKCLYFPENTTKAEFDNQRNCENDLITRKSTLFNEMKTCYPNCEERIYTPIISMTSWPLTPLAIDCKNAIINQHINNLKSKNLTVADSFYYFKDNVTESNFNLFSSNFAQVSISPYKAFSTKITEELSYSFFSLFSDIGGILGLYLGMSLLTVCEMFELILVIIGEVRSVKKTMNNRQQYMEKRTTIMDRLLGPLRKREQRSKIISAVERIISSKTNVKDMDFASAGETVVKDLRKSKMKVTKPPKVTKVEPHHPNQMPPDV